MIGVYYLFFSVLPGNDDEPHPSVKLKHGTVPVLCLVCPWKIIVLIMDWHGFCQFYHPAAGIVS